MRSREEEEKEEEKEEEEEEEGGGGEEEEWKEEADETAIGAEGGWRRTNDRNARCPEQEDAQGDGHQLMGAGPAPAAAATAAPPPPEREFRCHRVFFAACSEYFRALLYGGMSESRTRRVELRDVAPEGFEAIIAYAYTGQLLVTAGDTAQQLHSCNMEYTDSSSS